MSTLFTYLEDFASLFFPKTCCACGHSLVKNEELICTSCRYNLPYTEFHLLDNNMLQMHLAGRFKFEFSIACLYYYKQSKVQNLIHNFKYKNKPKLGVLLGTMYADHIKYFIEAHPVDLIMPVPLHTKKLRQRGYNQSAYFAQGLSEGLGIPADALSLKRVVDTDSQTSMSRFDRSENMKEAFKVENPSLLKGRHIMLVDDVVTTGSTLEGCALALLDIEGVKISVAAAAMSAG